MNTPEKPIPPTPAASNRDELDSQIQSIMHSLERMLVEVEYITKSLKLQRDVAIKALKTVAPELQIIETLEKQGQNLVGEHRL